MSGISKTIEKLKVDADELLAEPQVMNATDGVFAQTKEWAISVTDLITALEQSQQELEKSNDCLDTIGETHSGLLELYHKTNDELSKANKRIAGLGALLKRVEPSMVTTRELYRDITKALYVPKEQTDNERD